MSEAFFCASAVVRVEELLAKTRPKMMAITTGIARVAIPVAPFLDRADELKTDDGPEIVPTRDGAPSGCCGHFRPPPFLWRRRRG